MKVCRVIGTVVATVRHEDFASLTLLLCQPLDKSGKKKGNTIIAVDRVQAGVGDRVLVLSEGSSCRHMWNIPQESALAIRSSVVGVIDHIDIDQRWCGSPR